MGNQNEKLRTIEELKLKRSVTVIDKIENCVLASEF